jgi:hypothetical protein
MRGPIAHEIAAVRSSLAALDRALMRLARSAREDKPARVGKQARSLRRRKLHLSPARKMALQLHGRYLGYVRQLKPRAKAEVKALRAKRGIRVAIARAKRLAAA